MAAAVTALLTEGTKARSSEQIAESVDRLGGYAELGLDRIVMFPSRWDTSDEGLASFAADVRSAGLPLAGQALSLAGK